MSKFHKALEQAELERALREGTARPASGIQAGPISRAPRPVEAPAAPEAQAIEPSIWLPAAAEPGDRRGPAPPGPAPEPAGRSTARRSRSPRPRIDEGLDEHLVSLILPSSFEAEQYRALRHLIKEASQAKGQSVFAVSSPAVGDGKTTTALNLAAVLGESAEARVLLIDADLRRPGVAAQLGWTDGRDEIGGFLDARVPLEKLVRTHAALNFDVLSAGRRRGSAYEVLESSRFQQLIQQARERYTYVLLDTPPLVGLPDCRAIGRVVDAFLVLVAAHKTPRKLLEAALRIVGPDKLLGLVFNQDDYPLSGYYRYGHLNGRGRARS